MALRRMVILPRRGLRRDTSDVITLADHARDAGEWERGAELYRNALDRYPRNSGIWVQYGHALKESGELRDPEKLAQAEAAYRRALSLDPSVADTHLQLGHVLKLQDKIEEARGAYLRAFVLDRSLDSASLELAQLGWSEVHFSQLRSMLGTECIGAPETPPCAFILNSLQHLTQLEDGSFLTTGHDPQFALITSDGHLPHGSILFTVETKEADPLLRPTLYVWGGETGEEITSFSLPIMWSALVSETAIQLPQRVTAMRLDPADQAGVSFKLGSVAFSRLPALPEPSLSAPSRTDYDLWVRLYDSLHQEDTDAIRYHIAHLAVRPLLSVVMSVHNPDPHYIRCALDSVLGQLYPDWELCIADDASTDPQIRTILEGYVRRDSRIKIIFRLKNGHISASSNTALELVSGDFVVLMDHDDELPPHSLYMIAAELNAHPDTDIIYTDEDKLDAEGRRNDPYFKTDWNVELFYSQNMVAHMGVYRTSLVRKLGGFRVGMEGSQDYDFVLRALSLTTSERIRHIPFVLYHWRIFRGVNTFSSNNPSKSIDTARRSLVDYFKAVGQQVEVLPIESFPSWWRIKRPLPEVPPAVTLIVPTRDRVSLLRRCMDGLLYATNYPDLKVIIVDNGSIERETLAYFDTLKSDGRVQILRIEGAFNFSLLNNQAAKIAETEYIGFVNNDIQVIGPGWLKEMMSQLTRPDIGAVGAKLLYANGNIQHAGVILGIHGVAAHSHRHFPADAIGYFGRPQLQTEVSAVTAALMIVRKRVFEEVGGFDEINLPVAYNDVDLCLRIRDAGYRIIYTPFAELYHLESASRGPDVTPEQQERDRRERTYMMERWGKVLDRDSFYSPNLSLSDESYQLAFPPRVVKPWLIAASPPSRWRSDQQQRFDREYPIDANQLRAIATETTIVIGAPAAFTMLSSLTNGMSNIGLAPARIVVVDTTPDGCDASTTSHIEWLRRANKGVSIEIARDDGQDFNLCRACNVGVRAASDTEYLLIVAEDCTFSPNWFDYLLKAFCASSCDAVVASRIFLPSGRIEQPTTLLDASFQQIVNSADSYDALPVPHSSTLNEIATLPVLQGTSLIGGGVFFGRRKVLCSSDADLFDELFYVTGNEEDLALRLRVKQTPIAVTSASTISLVKERSFDSVCLWEYLHDLAWLNRKWSGHGDTGLVEFVCPFHRGDVLIALQVAAQATRMGKDIRLHVAESLLGWAQDFSPDFPIEALPVPVPSAEETSSTLLRSYMHLVRRSDVAPRIARSHPRRDLNVTDRNLVAYMLEAIGLPRDTMLINLRPNTQPRHEKEANEVLQSCGESVILLHPLGGWQLKTIPNPMRRDLARIVHQHGFTLIQIGGPDDQKFTECDGWIAADLSPAHWMVIFQKAKALIGVDSWSAHFATIVDIPQITLYGPTNPRHVNSKSFFTDRNHPSLTLGSLVDCSPCNSLKCLRAPVDYCMGYGLSIQAVDRFLRGLRKSGPAFDKNLEQSNTSPNPQWTGSVKRDIRSSSPPLEGVEQLYVSGYRNPLTRYR